MPVSREELRRLHFINTLFAHVTGEDLYLAKQIASTIAFSLGELEEQSAGVQERSENDDTEFNAAAARLLGKLLGSTPKRGFFHWNASRTLTSATPLFARSEIMTGLKQLAPFRESTFLITNLRPALLPSHLRLTSRRNREYEETVAFVRELIAARIKPSASLQVIFL